MNWSVAEAKEQLSEVLRHAATRPQTITRRARDIAVVIDVEDFRSELSRSRPDRRARLAGEEGEAGVAA